MKSLASGKICEQRGCLLICEIRRVFSNKRFIGGFLLRKNFYVNHHILLQKL